MDSLVRRFMSRSIRKLVVLALLIVLGASACARNDVQVIAFPIGPAGATANADFEVPQTQTYAFSLEYFYKEGDQADRAQVWKLAGGSVQESPGKWVEPGAPLRVHVRVVQKQGGAELPIAEQMVGNPRLSSWGSGTLSAELFAVPLSPGRYRVTVVSLDEARSFLGARTSLHVGRAYRGK